MAAADIEAIALAVVIFAGCVAESSRLIRPGARLAAVVVVGLLLLAAGGLGRIVEPEYQLPHMSSGHQPTEAPDHD